MNLFLVNKKKITHVVLTLFLVLIFKAVLDLSCLFLVNDLFAVDFSFVLLPKRMGEAYAVLFFSTLLLANVFYDVYRPSRIVFFIYFVFLILPLLSIYGLRLDLASRNFVYMVLLGFFIAVFVSQFKYRIHVPVLSTQFVWLGLFLSVVMTLYVYACLIHGGALSRINFNMYNVYEVRSQANYGAYPFMSYLLSWQAYVINMIFLVVGLLKRSSLMVLIALLAQVVLFGMTNFKSFLFAPLLVTFLFFFSNRPLLLGWLLIGSLCTVGCSWMFYSVFGEVMMPSIFIRRLFLVPADIHFWYYDFFSQSQNPFVFLSNSFLAPFFSFPYDASVTSVISWEYLGREGGPNVGYLGDAYAHFGLWGMVVFSCILGMFLYVLDSVTASLPPAVAIAIISIPSMALVNSALFTTFLTHGFVMAFVSLWVLSGWLQKENSPCRGFRHGQVVTGGRG